MRRRCLDSTRRPVHAHPQRLLPVGLAVRSAIAASTGAAVLAFAPPSAAADPAPVPYPTGYRNWTHVKSLQIQSGHPLYDAFGGIHHLYANAKAMEGYRKGRFPDGAVIVFDLLEAKEADKTVGTGLSARGRRRHAQGLEALGRDRRLGATRASRAIRGPSARSARTPPAPACRACRAAQKDKDYVFSASGLALALRVAASRLAPRDFADRVSPLDAGRAGFRTPAPASDSDASAVARASRATPADERVDVGAVARVRGDEHPELARGFVAARKRRGQPAVGGSPAMSGRRPSATPWPLTAAWMTWS